MYLHQWGVLPSKVYKIYNQMNTGENLPTDAATHPCAFSRLINPGSSIYVLE